VQPVEKAEKPAKASTRKRAAEAFEAVEDVKVDEDDFAADIAESMHCDCGVEARYVRGKSGNGWVCGNFGADDACNFRKKDTTPEPAFDPFEDEVSAELTGAALNGKGH
jgi:hypothetical protein